jgi:predicted RNase H-like nuclease (RuvC/YqgF family)
LIHSLLAYWRGLLDRIRREAAESIEESLRKGEEPLYRIKDNGDVETADGRSVDHYRDYIRALDERIGKLDREITELEAEEENLQERNLYLATRQFWQRTRK